MKAVEKKYIEELREIRDEIQASPQLAAYLESEEETDYKALQEAFEPKIEAIYQRVITKFPLEILALEDELLDDAYEGMMLPRILGYTVLRGTVNDNYRFKSPNDRFHKVLKVILTSNNFDVIQNRIGQSVQIGFALAGDIWVTSFVDELTSKRAENYLKSQTLEKYKHISERKKSVENYRLQFKNHNYYTLDIPKNAVDFTLYKERIREFLIYRIANKLPHDNYEQDLLKILEREELQSATNYIELFVLVVNFMELEEDDQKRMKVLFDKLRTKEGFDLEYLDELNDIHYTPLFVGYDEDMRVKAYVDSSKKDELTKYYDMMALVADKGYSHPEAIEAIRSSYFAHDGLSIYSECIRRSVFGHFEHFMNNISVEEYHEYFEVNKIFTQYVKIFDNQKFNQGLKNVIVKYLKKCLKRYTDKRGRDYQDIKKFIIASFAEMNLMKEKDVLNMFKTKRKPRVVKE